MVGGNGKTPDALARKIEQLELSLETLAHPGFGHSRQSHSVKARSRCSHHPRGRITIRTAENMTGTSTSMPTTVASAAPD